MGEKISSPYVPGKKEGACPLCASASLAPYVPFCSRRCAQLDLSKWLNEDYVIFTHSFDEDGDLEKPITQIDKTPSIS